MQSNNFKSIDPEVTCAKEIDNYIGLALLVQHRFERRTTPWEKNLWDDDELEHIMIYLKTVDRLYYIYCSDDHVKGYYFQMVGRMIYKGRLLYVDLHACCGCSHYGLDLHACCGCSHYGYMHGVIFVSRDPNLFMKLVMTDKFQKDLIYKSLVDDGIIIEEQTEYDSCERMFWKNAPMLKYLCHQVVYENRIELKHYSQVLPKLLTISIEDFIRTKDAKKVYDDGLCSSKLLY